MDKKKMISALVLLLVMLLFALWPQPKEQKESGQMHRVISVQNRG